jgi:predicted acylesterase/phospholipase RssA
MISPTRSHQKPRLLNHLTSPDVLIARASLACCEIPGVFPPVALDFARSSINYRPLRSLPGSG